MRASLMKNAHPWKDVAGVLAEQMPRHPQGYNIMALGSTTDTACVQSRGHIRYAMVLTQAGGAAYPPVADPFALLLRLFKTSVARGDALADIAGHLNTCALGCVKDSYFGMVLLEVCFNKVVVLNAGMPDVLLLDEDSKVSAMLPAKGLPLGMLPSMDLTAVRVPLPSGYSVLVPTDGAIAHVAANLDGRRADETESGGVCLWIRSSLAEQDTR